MPTGYYQLHLLLKPLAVGERTRGSKGITVWKEFEVWVLQVSVVSGAVRMVPWGTRGADARTAHGGRSGFVVLPWNAYPFSLHPATVTQAI